MYGSGEIGIGGGFWAGGVGEEENTSGRHYGSNVGATRQRQRKWLKLFLGPP